MPRPPLAAHYAADPRSGTGSWTELDPAERLAEVVDLVCGVRQRSQVEPARLRPTTSFRDLPRWPPDSRAALAGNDAMMNQTVPVVHGLTWPSRSVRLEGDELR